MSLGIQIITKRLKYQRLILICPPNFQTLDINGDGQVSPSELRKALKFMNIKVDKTVCSRMVYEFNPDGFLNIDIFMDLMAELFQDNWLSLETVRECHFETTSNIKLT